MENNLKKSSEKSKIDIVEKVLIGITSIGFAICSTLCFANAYKCVIKFSIDCAFEFGWFVFLGLMFIVAFIKGVIVLMLLDD